jgi:uncharacterized membrane protein YraQ (UPF0718 family)
VTKTIKQYRFSLVVVLILVMMTLYNRELGGSAATLSLDAIGEMLKVLPPIFILLGLLDVWIPRQTLSAYLGESAGFKGAVLAYIIGSAAAGPLYGAFPVAAVFIKKGASLFNIFIFIGAWSMTKIPMLLFEITSLGLDFMLTRLVVNIIGIFIMAKILNSLLSETEKHEIINRAEEMTRG